MNDMRPYLPLRLLMRLACLAVALLLLPPSTLASDASPEDWRHEPRTVAFQADNEGFRFSSERETALAHDTLQGEFRAADAVLRLSFASYEPEATAFRVDLGFVALLEFLDQDGDGRYGLPDTEVRRFPLESRSEWTIAAESAPAGTHAALARLPLEAGQAQGGILDPDQPPPPGLLTLRFAVGERDRSETGRILAPTDVALGLQVERFPFSANESRLALETRLESSVGVHPGIDGLEGAEGHHGWSLQWATTAELDGQSGPVQVNVLADPRLRDADDLDRMVTVAYGYGQADLLEYDPVLGVSRFPTAAEPVFVPAAPPGHLGLYVVGALGAGLMVGGTAWSRVRRRGW